MSLTRFTVNLYTIFLVNMNISRVRRVMVTRTGALT